MVIVAFKLSSLEFKLLEETLILFLSRFLIKIRPHDVDRVTGREQEDTSLMKGV